MISAIYTFLMDESAVDHATSPECVSKGYTSCSPDQMRTAPTTPEGLDDVFLRMFVGCIPFDVDCDDILPIFQNYGSVVSLNIARDEMGNSLCYAFVEYEHREDYELCIMNLHNLFYCGQMPVPMQLRFIEPETAVGEYKVFVGGLPCEMSAEDIQFHFGMLYGPVFEVVMLRKATMSSSAAFVKFLYKSSADQLIEDAAIQSVALPSGDVSSCVRASYAHSITESVDPSRNRIVRPPLIHLPTGMEYSPTKLFVGCLPYSKLATDVAEAFETFGPLVEVAVLTDVEGRSKGAAFVTFANKDHALEALRTMTGYMFGGSSRPINVSFAHKQSAAPMLFYQPDEV